MSNPILTTFRHAGMFMRTVTGTVLVTFTMLVLAPAAMAAQADIKKAKQEALLAPTEEDELSKTVLAIDEKLKGVKEKLGKGKNVATEKGELKALREKVETLDLKVMEHFAAIEQHIKDKNLAPVILQRQQEAVAGYKKDLAALLANLKAMEKAGNDADLKKGIDDAVKHLASRKLKRAQQPFDPNNLPTQSLKPSDAKPRTKQEEFTRAGLFDTPYQKYAALGDFRYDKLAGASDPAYLAETIEVKLSQAVKDKAAELNHDPVKIYHWVRNNVEWLPTWGSMQDADHTLSSKRGNAMDIASLTIALLRGSGIPARYVHGSIDVPEATFRNWAGGFENIDAAMNFAASGGIPTTGVMVAGKIAKVRIEHLWVEAAIDYQPSKGAVNRDADSWVEMDPSFKQYEYLSGLDVAAISGLDPQALGQSFLESGTVNETEGWVQGFDASILETAQAQAKTALENHIAGMENPTVGDVIGGRKAIIHEYPVLPSTLANHVAVRGTRYGELPEALRPSIELGFGADLFGDFVKSKRYAWAALNNRKVTLSFKPATEADEAALLSLLPEGEIIDINQLPQSIPSYLIRVVPELKVEAETVLTGDPMRLGEDLPFVFKVALLDSERVYPSPVVAGSYLSVAVVGGSVSTQILNNVQARLDSVMGTLESRNQALIGSLTREDIIGDTLYAGTLGYFAEYQVLGTISALKQKNHFTVAPSAGTYGYTPEVDYLFGFPRSIKPGGVEMDLDRVSFANSVDGKGYTAKFNFTFQLCALSSALEHAIPEQMFVTPESPGEAVSAVKALQKAAQQGQRIYHITQANQATALPNIHQDAETMSEIRSALAAGKEVIVHTDPISVPGWSGAGYVIYDAETGDGAWKIGGGVNGGWLVIATFVLMAVLMFFAFYSGNQVGAGLIFLQFKAFAESVKHIAATAASPEEAYADLKKLLFLTSTSVALALISRFGKIIKDGELAYAPLVFLSGIISMFQLTLYR